MDTAALPGPHPGTRPGAGGTWAHLHASGLLPGDTVISVRRTGGTREAPHTWHMDRCPNATGAPATTTVAELLTAVTGTGPHVLCRCLREANPTRLGDTGYRLLQWLLATDAAPTSPDRVRRLLPLLRDLPTIRTVPAPLVARAAARASERRTQIAAVGTDPGFQRLVLHEISDRFTGSTRRHLLRLLGAAPWLDDDHAEALVVGWERAVTGWQQAWAADLPALASGSGGGADIHRTRIHAVTWSTLTGHRVWVRADAGGAGLPAGPVLGAPVAASADLAVLAVPLVYLALPPGPHSGRCTVLGPDRGYTPTQVVDTLTVMTTQGWPDDLVGIDGVHDELWEAFTTTADALVAADVPTAARRIA